MYEVVLLLHGAGHDRVRVENADACACDSATKASDSFYKLNTATER